jgi:DNA polymerase IV
MPTGETDSTVCLMHLLHRLWSDRPEPQTPLLKVGVTLTRLVEQHNHTPSLFDTTVDENIATPAATHRRLDATLDALRARYGRGAVYFGSVHDSRDTAPMRISFHHIPDLRLEQD